MSVDVQRNVLIGIDGSCAPSATSSTGAFIASAVALASPSISENQASSLALPSYCGSGHLPGQAARSMTEEATRRGRTRLRYTPARADLLAVAGAPRYTCSACPTVSLIVPT